MDEAIVTTQVIDGKPAKTLQWRHYNVPHNNGRMILPDIDNIARCLMVMQRAEHQPIEIPGNWINTQNNYSQFGNMMKQIQGNGHSGIMTYFGEKPDNDIDIFCNISALLSIFGFLSNGGKGTKYNFLNDVISYVNDAVHDGETEAEYYDPIKVLYNYSKLMRFYEIPQIVRERLRKMLLGFKPKNVLESALSANALMEIGEINGAEALIRDIIKLHRTGSWDAFAFYHQRHPRRIFGSRGVTTAICLEALNTWSKISGKPKIACS